MSFDDRFVRAHARAVRGDHGRACHTNVIDSNHP
jgi:hypothetical protein